METIDCIFCKSSEYSTLFKEENDYTAHKCLKCGLIFLSPRPIEQEMKILYEKDSAGGNSFEEHIRSSYTHELEDDYTVNIIKKYKKKGKLLELGSGGGHFLTIAQREGYEVFGTEMNSQLLDYLKNNKQIPAESVENGVATIFNNIKFDIIYHKNVISHLHNPIKTFKEFREKMKKDGLLVFETGNIANLAKYWGYLLGKLSLPEHVFFMSEKNIEQLLEVAGFKLIKTYRHSIIPIRTMMKLRNLLPVKSDKMPKKDQNAPKRANFTSKSPSFLKKLRSFIIFSFTYKLPFILPNNTPATNIYVAKLIK